MALGINDVRMFDHLELKHRANVFLLLLHL